MSSESSDAQNEIAALRREIAKLRKRVAELENNSKTTASSANRREQAVLEALAGREGEAFSVNELKEIYRRSTDVSNSKTLRRRLKQLTKREEFERKSTRHGPTEWHFVGDGGGTE